MGASDRRTARHCERSDAIPIALSEGRGAPRSAGVSPAWPVRVGVLGLQGDFAAHAAMLATLDSVTPVVVRDSAELRDVAGLIVPGGESTTIGKLLVRTGVGEVLTALGCGGLPVFGTCAGMILMARSIEGSDQPRLDLLDIGVARNAFGRQADSFEADISCADVGPDPVRGVFIRAPYVTRVGPGVAVTARYEERIVAVESEHLMATAFHPELTTDTRIHERFVGWCREYAGSA